jgi:hypothetical protein
MTTTRWRKDAALVERCGDAVQTRYAGRLKSLYDGGQFCRSLVGARWSGFDAGATSGRHENGCRGGGNLLIRLALGLLQGGYEMQKTSLVLIAGAAILAATSLANAQSATPIEGNPSAARPAPPVSGTVVMPASPSTTGAAPNSAAPKSEGAAHMPGGNPDRAPGSTQTHEPPAR